MKSKQNKVPSEFDSFYTPILNLKKILQSNNKQQHKAIEIVQGFVMLHYGTFVMLHLYKRQSKNPTKILIVRELIEFITDHDSCNLYPDQIAKLLSLIDALGKELNTTLKPYVYIALYEGYLDSQIYYHFHQEYNIYDFAEFQSVTPDTLARMKSYSEASHVLLNEVGLTKKD